jgi:hypothetical protein
MNGLPISPVGPVTATVKGTPCLPPVGVVGDQPRPSGPL